MNELHPAPASTRALLGGLAELFGAKDVESETLEGFELARGGVAAHLGPDPLDETRLLILMEIALLDLRDPGASANYLLQLHHWNAACRPPGRWIATIEEDDTVCLRGSFPVASLDPQSLHALVLEGFDKAVRLHPNHFNS
jgi:hypothetical protein